MPQRPVGDALHRPAVKRGDRHRYQQHDQQDHRNHGEAERDQDQERDQRDEAADHEDVAMGEIDHADDAVDHGVADGDQAIDRAEHDAVDQLLGEIVHALPLSGVIRGDGPGSRNDASSHFLTAGTRGGNSAGAAKGLYRGSLGPVPRPQSRQAAPRNDRRGTGFPETKWQVRRLSCAYVQQGRSRCRNQNQNPGQQNQNPGQKPGQQQGGGQKPGQQQQDPNRQGQNPGQKADR